MKYYLKDLVRECLNCDVRQYHDPDDYLCFQCRKAVTAGGSDALEVRRQHVQYRRRLDAITRSLRYLSNR